MKKPFRNTELSTKKCISCARRLKANLLVKKPKAEKCYRCYWPAEMKRRGFNVGSRRSKAERGRQNHDDSNTIVKEAGLMEKYEEEKDKQSPAAECDGDVVTGGENVSQNDQGLHIDSSAVTLRHALLKRPYAQKVRLKKDIPFFVEYYRSYPLDARHGYVLFFSRTVLAELPEFVEEI